MFSLTVYKASAGSGKTFTLATEYIEQLIANPTAYRSILAVTFTNKATGEMKQRILSQLYGLAHRLPSSRGYMDRICADLEAGEAFVSKRAGEALRLLIHDYSSFRVMTIDSFFQVILRSLARELDLTSGLRVDLNDKQVMEKAVDKLIEEMNDDKQLRSWVWRYVKERIDEGEAWNVKSKIKALGTTIFSEEYRRHRHQLTETIKRPGFLEHYIDLLDKAAADATGHMAAFGKAGIEAMDTAGLSVDDFSQKKGGAAGRFALMTNPEAVFDKDIFDNKYVQTALADDEAWLTKTNKRRGEIMPVVCESLAPILHEASQAYPLQRLNYNTATLIRRNIHQLRLLHRIETRVRELCEESGQFLLSDTTVLLGAMIQGTDAPFIFEKMGAKLNSVMIDEFQDTSLSQWRNFKVLLKECMSHRNTRNLIVGDVKQSIYRWRAGDWRLLAGISNEFDHAEEALDIRTLDTNYRSERRVIEFNNKFFPAAIRHEAAFLESNGLDAQMLEAVKTAYDDVEQAIPKSRPDAGGVHVEMLTDDAYAEQMGERVAGIIHRLTDAGVDQQDIAIICRNNKDIDALVTWFMKYDPQIKLVSAGAFRLDASPAVNMTIAAMRLLDDPADELNAAYLKKAARKYTDIKDPIAIIQGAPLHSLPIREIIQRVSDLLHLEMIEGQTAYIATFIDYVSAFTRDYVPTLGALLKEWDEQIREKKIESGSTDGVRILTIHGSKGLEYEHVIVPYCNWELEKSGDIIWCQPGREPFSELPVAPVPYTKKMQHSHFARDWQIEKMQLAVDNMNVLYVAFTRACRGLHIIAKDIDIAKDKSAKKYRSYMIDQTLHEMVASGEPIIATEHTDPDDSTGITVEYDYGNAFTAKPVSGGKDEATERNVFLLSSTSLPVEMEASSDKVGFRQSRRADEFTSEETDEYINIGLAAHSVLANIRTAKDTQKALRRLTIEGVLSERDADRVGQKIEQTMQMPQVAGWFEEGLDIATEQTILTADNVKGRNRAYRPDRVVFRDGKATVIDFKTGAPRPENMSQVQQYMRLLKQMGYDDVEGYLLYIMSQSVVKVECQEA